LTAVFGGRFLAKKFSAKRFGFIGRFQGFGTWKLFTNNNDGSREWNAAKGPDRMVEKSGHFTSLHFISLRYVPGYHSQNTVVTLNGS